MSDIPAWELRLAYHSTNATGILLILASKIIHILGPTPWRWNQTLVHPFRTLAFAILVIQPYVATYSSC